MTSQILQEGILDVKAPRGSEDRKLWKVWRCQWICFSVVYPSGRREPYLVLDLASSTSKTPYRQITISRDGLRLFRCTSKSRPLRTWAIMSGEKPLLYFAAESEIRAQDWMQSLRDGLWPPCFSFQMLTACSHEVSLIDDKNTFLSGLLGVYGRLVLTSEDVISLMHPHWGAVLLQISLPNIKDVVLVREAEVPPAGVFSIVLKCGEDAKVKALYFYSVTAIEAIQWILSKVLAKCEPRKNQYAKRKLTKSNSDSILSSAKSLLVNVEDEHINISDSETLHYAGKNNTGEQINLIDISDEYKNLKSLELSSDQNPFGSPTAFSNNSLISDVYGIVRKQTSKETSEQNVIAHPSKDECLVDISANTDDLKNKAPHFNFLKDVYLESTEQGKEISSKTEMPHINDVRNSFNFVNSNSDYENLKIFNENFAQTKYSLVEHIDDALNSAKYTVANEKNSKDLSQLNAKAQTSENSILNDVINTNKNYPSSKSNLQNSYIDNVTLSTSNIEYIHNETALSSSSSLNEINASSSVNDRSTEFSMKWSDVLFTADANYSKNNLSFYACSSEYRKKDSNGEIMQSYTGNKSDTEKSCLLLNTPSDFLNTSISSVHFNNKSSGSYSSDEDLETPMPWTADEFHNFDLDDSGEHVYEDLSERKGTVYEEIDESDSDEVIPRVPPLLPDRPKNLEIPSSLRLKKLSDSIKDTLNLVEIQPPPPQRHTNTKFIKKIKEMNRVMYISRNREMDSQLEDKFLSGMKNVLVSEPSTIRPLNNEQNSCNKKRVSFDINSINSIQS